LHAEVDTREEARVTQEHCISPEALAARALGVDERALLASERIKHGLTNDSWRVRTRDAVVIVRMGRVPEAVLQIDRASEARVLQAVAAAGIGAEVLLCDPARQWLVTRDLGEPWREAQAHEPQNIRRLAEVLRRLHALPVPAGVRRVDLLETLRGYLRTLEDRGQSPDAAERERGEQAAVLLQENAMVCLCHNDVHHLNVVDDGTLRLIDWEYSGVGTPWFDLASLCVYHGFTSAERELLLESYFSQRPMNALARLELACWLFDYIRRLWMVVRADAEAVGIPDKA
jgi:thiamine kinase